MMSLEYYDMEKHIKVLLELIEYKNKEIKIIEQKLISTEYWRDKYLAELELKKEEPCKPVA